MSCERRTGTSRDITSLPAYSQFSLGVLGVSAAARPCSAAGSGDDERRISANKSWVSCALPLRRGFLHHVRFFSEAEGVGLGVAAGVAAACGCLTGDELPDRLNHGRLERSAVGVEKSVC